MVRVHSSTLRFLSAAVIVLLAGTGLTSSWHPVAAQVAARESGPDYVIGPADVLGILVWREPELSLDVVVRPDGFVTIPLVQDVRAAGLTPSALRQQLQERLAAFVQDANVSVIVREVNSRQVHITGQVVRPGAYALVLPLRVVDVIALAGGLLEFADARHITVLRADASGRQSAVIVDYRAVARGERLSDNIPLLPGDTIIVP